MRETNMHHLWWPSMLDFVYRRRPGIHSDKDIMISERLYLGLILQIFLPAEYSLIWGAEAAVVLWVHSRSWIQNSSMIYLATNSGSMAPCNKVLLDMINDLHKYLRTSQRTVILIGDPSSMMCLSIVLELLPDEFGALNLHSIQDTGPCWIMFSIFQRTKEVQYNIGRPDLALLHWLKFEVSGI